MMGGNSYNLEVNSSEGNNYNLEVNSLEANKSEVNNMVVPAVYILVAHRLVVNMSSSVVNMSNLGVSMLGGSTRVENNWAHTLELGNLVGKQDNTPPPHSVLPPDRK